MNLRPQAPILLVDDEPANLLALEAVLQDVGEPLVRASSGQEALRQLRDRDFAAVLLDVRMPGMDGFETARLIRAQRRSRRTPIIFVTADPAAVSSIEEAYGLGAVDFLAKPLMPAALKGKVGFFVELHRSKQELEAAERQAVQDRAFLSAVLEAVEDGIVACGPDKTLTLLNRATRQFHGLDAPPLSVEHWDGPSDLYRADGKTPLPHAEVPLFRALSGEHVQDVEIVIAPPGHKARSVLVSGQPLTDESGGKIGAVVSMHDITARKEAQKARAAAAVEQVRRQEAEAAATLIRESQERLRASEERVRLATQAAGLGVWVWDVSNGNISWENERLYQLFGVKRSRAPADTRAFVAEFVHPQDASSLQQAVELTASSGGRLHFEGRFFRRDDRSLRCIELTGILQPGAKGTPRRILGCAADITERKQAEEELRRSEERYRTLFESIDEGFCVIEMILDEVGHPVDYRFLEMNPAFAKHTGLVAAAGKRMRELVPDHEDHWFEIYGRVARSGEPRRFEHQAKAMGRWFDVYAIRLGGPGSLKVAVIFSDITERKQAEENLRQLAAELAETDRRKTEFLATLAHELRNPLAPLTNGLQLLRIAGDDPQVQQRARDMMERQLRHLVRLVDDLLDMARISSGKVDLKKETVDLAAVLGSAVETSAPLLNDADHTLEQRLPSQTLHLMADPTRIAQVVSNLLNNAARYTPGGGHIVLSAQQEGDEAVIRVSDTGIGIAPDALGEVFEMFTQAGRNRVPGGLGIGLALVRRLVELHGGTVTAQSPGPGKGSTFTVRLPLAQGPVGSSDVPPAPGSPAAERSFRVLVVDDNADAAESLATLLELSGHTIRTAHDGSEAVRAAHEFRPDIIFLDIGMPGKDGYEVARELRQSPATGQVVLVALTGWGAKDDRARSREAGFDHHLTKPAGLEAVNALIAQLDVTGAAPAGPLPAAPAH